MLKDLVKDDEKVIRVLKGCWNEVSRQDMYDDLLAGMYPPLSDWWWNTHEKAPCYIKGNEVYCFSYAIVGEMFLLGTLEELEEEIKTREEEKLTYWGLERIHFLNQHRYGEAFKLLKDGDLWTSCKRVEREALKRESELLTIREQHFAQLKDSDLEAYSNELEMAKHEVNRQIHEELIYV
jgi:hypothetical protein